MNRYVTIATAGIVACILGMMLMNQISNPMAARKAELERRLANTSLELSKGAEAPAPVEEWNRIILSKDFIWRSLVPPPPPPPPPPPKPPEPPNLQQMLSGVTATRQQVGDKVKFILPGNPRGDFLGVGDSINNVTIASISRTAVTFSYQWQQGNRELTHTMPRE